MRYIVYANVPANGFKVVAVVLLARGYGLYPLMWCWIAPSVAAIIGGGGSCAHLLQSAQPAPVVADRRTGDGLPGDQLDSGDRTSLNVVLLSNWRPKWKPGCTTRRCSSRCRCC